MDGVTPRVRQEARQRVQDAVGRTGYTPNLAARSFVASRTGVIGPVIPSRVNNQFEDPYFARVIQGVSAACNRAGKTDSLFVFQTEEEERRMCREGAEHRPDLACREARVQLLEHRRSDLRSSRSTSPAAEAP